MEFKGTKGKWELGVDCNIMSEIVTERIKTHKDEIVKKEDGEIAQCWQDFHDGTIIPRKECEANALLISKAPEMLEMLNRVLKLNNVAKEHISESFFTDIKQLIKEATEL